MAFVVVFVARDNLDRKNLEPLGVIWYSTFAPSRKTMPCDIFGYVFKIIIFLNECLAMMMPSLSVVITSTCPPNVEEESRRHTVLKSRSMLTYLRLKTNLDSFGGIPITCLKN